MKKLTPLFLTLALSAGLAVPAMAQMQPAEMGTFENFLNAHPKTAGELQQNPSLINNPQWMGNHHGLEEYMAAHPEVRADVHANPGAFLNNGGRWSWSNPGYHSNNQAARNFDNGYLDEHPEVSQQLARHPGLADDPQFLAAHPGLQNYLSAHPGVRYDLEHHPDRFMSQEDRMNGHPNGDYASGGYASGGYPSGGYPPPGGYHSAPGYGGPGYGGPGYGGPNYGTAPAGPNAYGGAWDNHHERPLGTADSYFDHHPEVYKQMQADPRLVDNKAYLESHPGLHDYLQDHPHARADFRHNPNGFMHAEEHYQENHPDHSNHNHQ